MLLLTSGVPLLLLPLLEELDRVMVSVLVLVLGSVDEVDPLLLLLLTGEVAEDPVRALDVLDEGTGVVWIVEVIVVVDAVFEVLTLAVLVLEVYPRELLVVAVEVDDDSGFELVDETEASEEVEDVPVWTVDDLVVLGEVSVIVVVVVLSEVPGVVSVLAVDPYVVVLSDPVLAVDVDLVSLEVARVEVLVDPVDEDSVDAVDELKELVG